MYYARGRASKRSAALASLAAPRAHGAALLRATRAFQYRWLRRGTLDYNRQWRRRECRARRPSVGRVRGYVVLRQLFLYLSTQRAAYRLLMRTALARRLAWRFVAGEREADALAAVRALARQGVMATLDHLGENVTDEASARSATDATLHLLGALERASLPAHVSIKLTQVGLDIDEDFCRQELRRILLAAGDIGTFVRIDMEGAAYTERTLRLFYEAHDEFGADAVGVVLQSYLYRTPGDIDTAIARQARVRLVKGAYDEPPGIAFPDKRDVDRAYALQQQQLLARGRYPALATHDLRLIGEAERFAAAEGLDQRGFEFQMLYGVRRDLQVALAAAGYNVRCYVPYGAQWYPYFMRRLAERPANLTFILRELARR